MRVLAVLVVLAGALAAGEPASDFAQARSLRQRALTDFWRAYRGRMNEADVVSYRPWLDAFTRMSDDREAVYDLTPYRRLYQDCAAIEEAFGKAAAALARSEDPEAPRALLRELFGTLDEVADAEKAVCELSASHYVSRLDQRPGIARHGLARRERALIEAIALHPLFLAVEAWPEAVRGDGRRSRARRVAVLDALGASARPEARPVLEGATASEEVPIRIAALEGLALHGPAATPALLPFLGDRSDIVRRALVHCVRSRLAADPRWIRPLLDAYPGMRGALRRGAVETLEVLTGRALGDDPARWAHWYEEHRVEIDTGRFTAGPRADEPATRASGPTFYGIPVRGRGTIFLFDWNLSLRHPADWNVERTRYYYDWLYGDQSWKREHGTHYDFLQEEFARTLRALEPASRFALVLGTDGYRGRVEEEDVYVLGFERLLEPTRAAIGRAERFVRGRKPYHWRSQFSMLLTALSIADRDPAADTAILLSCGTIWGGHYFVPEAAVEAFARENRFRRLVVDTVRIRDAKEDARILLQGFARVSGGRHVWLLNPPAGR